jgi:hypothetical protein
MLITLGNYSKNQLENIFSMLDWSLSLNFDRPVSTIFIQRVLVDKD